MVKNNKVDIAVIKKVLESMKEELKESNNKQDIKIDSLIDKITGEEGVFVRLAELKLNFTNHLAHHKWLLSIASFVIVALSFIVALKGGI